MYTNNPLTLLDQIESVAIPKGWKHVKNHVFASPSGSLHDLIGANLEQLDRIERERVCFLIHIQAFFRNED